MEEEHQSASPPKENPAPGRNTNFEGEDAGKVKLAKTLSLAAVIMAGIAFFMSIVDSIMPVFGDELANWRHGDIGNVGRKMRPENRSL